jgi:hypothetical protein
MMTAAEKEVADGLAELRVIAADYKVMKENWLAERRMILDTLYANAELRTVEIILTNLERSQCAWERWPPLPSPAPRAPPR